MADAKIYLNVPYPEKDAAKALGARWDAANKKWYVPGTVADLTPFAKWQTDTVTAGVSATVNHKPSTAPKPTLPATGTGVFTYASIKDFVAYNGDAPPWE
ncbi:hypothetical protein KEF85_04875 [Methylomonas paludis]|uniref:DUF5710 domain-containing protein n=1 Tax=Methylomonas paludis TaxID=1173101 RepID=A0A975RAX8_9GAMM|nr:DUF5710 domain-containing protein [Methylomonas paludis]QWF71808.1 hypothetical protein KEF85_04875 [Methylomonas paludis]